MISKVYNIDCMKFMKTLPEKFFDLSICDPPYGIGKDWKKRTKGAVFICGDYNNTAPQKEYFDELKRVSKHYIIWGYNYFTEFLGSTNYLIVWDKNSANNPTFHYSKCEIACTDIHIPCNIVHITWDGYRMSGETRTKKIHPHQKPVALYKWIIENYASAGDKIFDSHLGSGSSRIAAAEMGFDFYGCEIDKTIFMAMNKRFQDYSRQTRITF